MLQLSTPSTSFLSIKPNSLSIFAFVFLAAFDVVWVVNSYANPRITLWEFIGMPLFVSGMGYFGIRMLKNETYDNVDEVWLDGDALIVKHRGMTSRVALGDVSDAVDATIHSSMGGSVSRIRLTLRSGSSSLGDNISFQAGGARGPFGPLDIKSILATLKRRIDDVRQSFR